MQLIKLVLDDAYASICASDDDAKDALIRKELDRLSSEYSKLTDPNAVTIDYSDPLKRFAYIFKYTVAHADYIMQLIRKDARLRELFTVDNLEVACLGGGPGSDLLGILKYMIQEGIKDCSLTCYIFDKERSWGDSWSDVARILKPPFNMFPIFQQLDVTDATTWKSYHKFLRADLFTLSYFLSEVWKIKTDAEPFFIHCMSKMKNGAMMLFVDNNSSSFTGWFDRMAVDNGLNIITSNCAKLVFSNEEEKTDLGIFFEKFGWPKRESNAAYRILQKP